jgi:hypothetical protein
MRTILVQENVAVKSKQRRARGPSELGRSCRTRVAPRPFSSASLSAPFENGDDLSGSRSPSFLARAGRMHSTPSLGCRRVAVAGSALDIEDVRLRQRGRYPPVLRVLCYLGGSPPEYNLVVVFVVVPSAANVCAAGCKVPGATKE